MLYRELGRSGIRVSLVSYGAGGPSQFGKAAGLTDSERRSLIARAIDLGINLFDTAANYANGESETWLGQALEGHPRDSFMIATKWGWRSSSGQLPHPDALIESAEKSMTRLRTDYIDVMQIHGLNQQVYRKATEMYAPALLKLKETGKARLIGFSEMMTEDPSHTAPEIAVNEHHDIWDTIMLKYGILNQYAAINVLPKAQEHGIGILNMAPVRFTLTRADEYRALLEQWRDDDSIDVDHPKLRDGLGWLVRGNVPSVIAAGYKFAAAHPGISTVISGTSSIDHLEENVTALEDPSLPTEDMELLRELLMTSAAPR